MNANYAQAPVYHPPKRRSKLPIVVAILGTLCAFTAVLALAGYYFFVPQETTSPVVLIREPQHGDQFLVGERVTVRALARDENNITRIEYWADGQLLHAQTSNLPSGVSPLPLLTSWQPTTPGKHTLVVRAFNSQNQRSQASIDVEVIEILDQDNDSIPDAEDTCPDQPGFSATNGCPDADGDGVADAEDACPDEVGVAEAGGCPAADADDLDGDGVLNAEDACPEESGPAPAAGCPDRDGDFVHDAIDACPDEAGAAEDGCPLPAGAIPDGDGDGIADAEDECPHEVGEAEHAGCPDSDGDGLADREDLAPEDPGLPEDGGAPAGPDSDGDGAPDDADPCPEEAGEAEDGFCPPPGPADEEAEADFAPIPPGGGEEVVHSVEFDALSFEVTSDEYEWVWCYVLAGDTGWESYRFEPSGVRRWNLEEQFGGANSRTFWLGEGQQMRVSLQCWGWPGSPPSHYLGIHQASHGPEDWLGQVHTIHSEEGDEGHAFTAEYRLCSPSCDESVFPPPRIHTQYSWLGHQRLVWAWDGNLDEISGYAVYVDGARTRFVDKSRNSIVIDDYLPACGETREIQVTATDISGGFSAERESPLSNTWRLEGEPCPSIARITFQTLRTYNLPEDYGREYCQGFTGPIGGSFWATGSDDASLRLDTAYRAIWNYLTGVCLQDNYDHPIPMLFDECGEEVVTGMSDRERSLIHCPATNVVEVPFGPDDDLSFGGSIYETDPDGTWFNLFSGEVTSRAGAGARQISNEYVISDERGYMDLIVTIEILPSGP